MPLRAFIFDMDGVMLDSEPVQLRSFNAALAPFNASVLMPEFKHRYMGLRDTQICEQMVKDFSLSISAEELVIAKRAAYMKTLQTDGIPPTPGLIKAATSLHSRMPLGIASSSSKTEIEFITSMFGIRELFSVIVSGHEVKNGKPAPDVYLKASEMIGVAPEFCGVIEDTKTGVKAAKAAGMHCIGITTIYHSAAELEEADIVINSFDQFIETTEKLGV